MFSSNIGLIHTLFAFAAILLGGWVVLSKKGTNKHRILGYTFFAAIVLMNLTALFTQSLYQFGPFHWMAIVSLLTVSAGISAPLFLRHKPNWMSLHYELMLWSYVGLIAAMFAEISVRVPAVENVVGGGGKFWILVIAASILTFVIGGLLIGKHRKKYFN